MTEVVDATGGTRQDIDIRTGEVAVGWINLNEGDVVGRAKIRNVADNGRVGGIATEGWSGAVTGVAQMNVGQARRGRLCEQGLNLHVVQSDDQPSSVVGFRNAQPDGAAMESGEVGREGLVAARIPRHGRIG